MSKAFTKESEGDDEDDLEGGPSPIPPGSKNYITPLGHQRLKDELLFLLDKDRPAVTTAVSWAAKNGDRSENADYQYGKKRLREIDKRIRFLTKRLDNAEVVDPAAPRDAAALCRSPWRQPRNPARHISPKALVLRAECLLERRFFVHHHKDMKEKPE